MTFDEIIQALKDPSITVVDDDTVAAILSLMKTQGRPSTTLLMRYVSSERLYKLSVQLIKVPAYIELVKEWDAAQEPSPCPDSDDEKHCIHLEEVDGEMDAGCCFCGALFTVESAVPTNRTEHGIYVGEPSRDALIKAKNRMIMQGRLHVQTDNHGFGMTQLLKAADLEEQLAETAGTDPNGPQREDHLRSAASCRALAESKL